MEQPTPIRLPYELEKEAEEARLRALQEQIETRRTNGTLVSSVMEFLQMFEVKLTECNQYMQLFIPYPTISQMTKDNVRNKLRTLNDFYFSYTGSNPHLLICECMDQDTTEALQLHVLYKRLSDVTTRLNNNVACISNKQILFIAKRKPKDDSIWNEYDWT
jgi:hypothetical protein